MKYEFKYLKDLSAEEIKNLVDIRYRNTLGVFVHFVGDITIFPQEKGNWIDVACAEDVVLPPSHFTFEDPPYGNIKISLGFSMKLPKGYEAHLAPRSGTFSKYGIIQTNGVGIVDNSYCGTNDIWMMPVFSLGAHTLIPKGTRIAQFRFMPTMETEMFTAPSPAKFYNEPTIVFIICDELESVDRGGFGSTGI